MTLNTVLVPVVDQVKLGSVSLVWMYWGLLQRKMLAMSELSKSKYKVL